MRLVLEAAYTHNPFILPSSCASTTFTAWNNMSDLYFGQADYSFSAVKLLPIAQIASVTYTQQ